MTPSGKRGAELPSMPQLYPTPFPYPMPPFPPHRFVFFSEALRIEPEQTATLYVHTLQQGRLLRLHLDTFAKIGVVEVRICNRGTVIRSGSIPRCDNSPVAPGGMMTKRGLAAIQFDNIVSPNMLIEVDIKHCGKKPTHVILVAEFTETSRS